MNTEAWIAVVTAFVGGGGLTALTGYLQTRYKDRQRGQLEERQQVFDQQIGIVEKLDARFDRSEKERKEEILGILVDLRDCRQHHLECEELGALEGKIEILTALMMHKNEGPLVGIVTDKQLTTVEAERAT